MMLYGTYLAHLVLEQLKKQHKSLSVKQIGSLIHSYSNKRENTNFQRRIRNACKALQLDHPIITEQHRLRNNIIITKYKYNG